MGILTSAARIWLTRSFRPFEFTDRNDNSLDYQNLEDLGLYVHIPFCRSICDFCPYCKTVYNKDLADEYLDALLQEIDMVGSAHGSSKKTVSSLYFGGGSPALFTANIQKIIDRLGKYFDISEGIGLELHPQDVNTITLSELKQAGVTKISIGIQSFQKDCLKALGRNEIDLELISESLKKVQFETVSMDFIFTLPGQTIELLKKDIQTAFEIGANCIAVYPFIDFSFTSRSFKRINEKDKKRLFYQLINYCQKQGYSRDSVWTFSQAGVSKYSSMTRKNFLGFGCSATTLLKDKFKINTFDVNAYIKKIKEQKLPTALTLNFSKRQRMVYYLFWGAYTMHVNEKDFSEFFGCSLQKAYGFELLVARLLGWVCKEKNGYKMTTKGSYYYHYFEHFYTLSYIDKMWNLMRNEAFPQKLDIK
ncbi:MAG: radical SAM protein [Dehalococcoidales bacterium]